MKRPVFLGSAIATALVATSLEWRAANAAAPTTETFDARAQLAYDRRLRTAAAARDAFRASVSNGDETRFAEFDYVASFRKGLPRDAAGRVAPATFAAMRHAIAARDAKLLDPRSAPRLSAMIGHRLSADSCIAGCDPYGIPLSAPARIEERRTADDAIELAWLALTRDVPFSAYESDPSIAAAAVDLRRTPQTVFRPFGGAAIGPMISQFALVDVPHQPYGSLPQKHDFYAPQRDYLTTRDAWLVAQSGTTPPAEPIFEGRKRYIATNRDLAAWVVAENSPFDDAIAIVDALPTEALADWWDTNDVAGALALANDANRVATFHQKFAVHLRLRPEEFFGLVDERNRAVRIDAALRDSGVLDRLRSRFATALLPQAYTAGAPLHPSYPAAHASFAGVAATILKAHVRGDYPLKNSVVPTADGDTLVPYAGTPLTLGGEIDKLAANYAYGRHAAGVHYPQDSEAGLRYGEAVAIGILTDLAAMRGPGFSGYRFTSLDGKPISIEPST